MKALGICIGASKTKVIALERTTDQIIEIEKRTYADFDEALKNLDFASYEKICLTGRKLRKSINLTSITEAQACEQAVSHLVRGRYDALISAGSETTIVYELNEDGMLQNVFTGNKCASGTGSFYVQQLKRMDIDIENINDFQDVDEVYDISGRCSVFCKSDCTHALNNGIGKKRIVAGLSRMMAKKITDLLVSMKQKKVVIIGGISKIKPIVKFLEKEVDTLLIPENSEYFEAYGAAVWALGENTIPFTSKEKLYKSRKSSFTYLEPLKNAENLVEFKEIAYEKVTDSDECILGIDIGSTTTKAVLIRRANDSILASVYLRTNGDPVTACKECYRQILEQIKGHNPKIIALGTTGSGRHIAGLHAMTDLIYNEIICHATASVHFDSDVDTIFEIGGQDAKYTFITNGIPSDYAMNEACSAGTGSFLEEISRESLNVDVEKIAKIALQSLRPVNFNDQCSAFISSDIKTACQENIEKEDIVAGIVYSICKNYNNRVRGARPIGKKILMQGGVCYNKAVPIAMAALLKRKIVVPPEPGFMGAIGCALMIKKKIDVGLVKEGIVDLRTLITRDIEYINSFKCNGGSERCDRKCEINMFRIENELVPFGGACNKYFNLVHKISVNTTDKDIVAIRDKMLFCEYVQPRGALDGKRKSIGINKTFLTNMLYPLYFHFWDQLGFKVILSDEITEEGKEKRNASFCYPVEIAHGLFKELLDKKPDYIFMPHILHIPVAGCGENTKTCVFVQGEPYYLREAFSDVQLPPILSPVIDFQQDVNNAKKEFINTAAFMSIDKSFASQAFDFAYKQLEAFWEEGRKIYDQILKDLEKNPDEIAVVLMGRWYNSLAKEANMSIPQKIASRGLKVIPFDFVPYQYSGLDFHMHWGIGKILLEVSKIVRQHKQLFAVYITNFSCGPDSFLLSYFRDQMGQKPSLTLELDSHTADVGINTRIDAAIEVFQFYKRLEHNRNSEPAMRLENGFSQAKIEYRKNGVYFIDSQNNEFPINDPNVTILVPAMGRFLTDSTVAVLKGEGLQAVPIGEPSDHSLRLGKENTNCKECLPYTVTIGLLAEYVQTKKRQEEKVAYFFAGDANPCRVEQYSVGFKRFIKNNGITDVAIYSPSGDESFAGISVKASLKIWKALCAADALEQIYTYLLTHAIDKEKALRIFNEQWDLFLGHLQFKDSLTFEKRVKKFASELSKIKTDTPVQKAVRVTITGEIYVRTEFFCRQSIEEKLAEMGLVARIVPMIEWNYYGNQIIINNLRNEKHSWSFRMIFRIRNMIQAGIEKKVKNILSKSNMYVPEYINIKETLKSAGHLVDNRLIGENCLAIGNGLNDILERSYGVILYSPFACLQGRMAESILSKNMVMSKKNELDIKSNKKKRFGQKVCNLPLPFIAIETDGNPFPQIVEAKLEVFALQVKRLYKIVSEAKEKAV